jgi:hypothetical protein
MGRAIAIAPLLAATLATATLGATLGATTTTAAADPHPAGSLGATIGGNAGLDSAGAAMGRGVQYGVAASWQPMGQTRRVGWSTRWSTVFGYQVGAEAAKLSSRLRTVQMELGTGVRLRPIRNDDRFVTVRAGVAVLRANETLPPDTRRDYLGPFVTAGVEQYLFGAVLVSLDLRYGMITGGPATLSLFLTVGTGA